MTFTLFVRADCHDCDVVIAWLKKAQVPYRTADIDHEPGPGGLRFFAAPALCVNDGLVAYGVDIIPRLKELGYGQ
jgi:hypothetical protein